MGAIPRTVAVEVCDELYRANRGKWYTFNGLWCICCAKFSGKVENRCFAATPDNRGCSQVNRRYDRGLAAGNGIQ